MSLLFLSKGVPYVLSINRQSIVQDRSRPGYLEPRMRPNIDSDFADLAIDAEITAYAALVLRE